MLDRLLIILILRYTKREWGLSTEIWTAGAFAMEHLEPTRIPSESEAPEASSLITRCALWHKQDAGVQGLVATIVDAIGCREMKCDDRMVSLEVD